MKKNNNINNPLLSFFNFNNSPKSTIFTVFILFLLAWLASGFYKIEADQEGVVLRLGAYDRISYPGLNYHLPYPFETVEKVRTTVINQEIIGYKSDKVNGGFSRYLKKSQRNVPIKTEEDNFILTKDVNVVDVSFVVHWRVNNAADYLFNLRDRKKGHSVRSIAESAMRESIAKNNMNDVLAKGRERIEIEVKDIIQTVLDYYQSGVYIERVQLKDSDPPAEVIDAFRNVEAARAERETLINGSEKYRNEIIPQARGNAVKLIQEALAFANQVVLLAEGDKAKFDFIYNQYQKYPNITKKNIFIDTWAEVFEGMDKILIDPEISDNFIPFLPLSKEKNIQSRRKQRV